MLSVGKTRISVIKGVARTNIQGFQKLTLLDYPAHMACTVFTGGCNLRCPFCHNAGLVRNPIAEKNLCKEVLQYLESRKGVLEGVCVTGGEPLLQPDLKDFLEKVKELGYSIKLDTNGSLPKKLQSILKLGLVDYVAMDIKSSPSGYALASGSDIVFGTFLESIEIIRQSGVEYEFRTTAVKGIHKACDFIEIAKLLEPHEKYFIQGFIDSGNLLSGGEAFSYEEMQEIIAQVQKIAPKALLRGQK